jgi:DNA-directed RNA polymerase specialized sigma subunit
MIDKSVPNQVCLPQKSPWEWTMWTDRLDAKMLKLKRDGLSFAEISEKIGVTRNAAIGRFQRINGVIFPSQTARRQTREAAAKLKEDARLRKDREIIRKLRAALAAGTSRSKATKQAFFAGGSHKAIGNELGVSRQRVYQIAVKE